MELDKIFDLKKERKKGRETGNIISS